MSEYTPTRQELIAAWIESHQEAGWGGPVDIGGRPKERITEAHRGLAEVERAAAEKAWDEREAAFGADLLKPLGDNLLRETTSNPYRLNEGENE